MEIPKHMFTCAWHKSFTNPRDRHVEIAQTRAPWLVEGPHGHSRMPLKKCQWYGCHNEDLTEITAAEEDFCKCLEDPIPLTKIFGNCLLHPITMH